MSASTRESPRQAMASIAEELEKSRKRVRELERALLLQTGQQSSELLSHTAVGSKELHETSKSQSSPQSTLGQALPLPAGLVQSAAHSLGQHMAQAMPLPPGLVQSGAQPLTQQTSPSPGQAPASQLQPSAQRLSTTTDMKLPIPKLGLDTTSTQPSLAKPGATDSGGLANDQDEAQWTEVFRMLESGSEGDRAAHLALTVATLKRKGDELQQQMDALQLAQTSLMQAAMDEAKEAVARKNAEPRGPKQPKTDAGAKAWGRALALDAVHRLRAAVRAEAQEEPPFRATELARDALQQAARTLEAQAKAHAEAQSKAQLQAVVQAQQVLLMQAEAVAQAQAMAEAQAQALSEVQAQAQAVAEMQLELQAEAAQAQEQQQELEAAAAERQEGAPRAGPQQQEVAASARSATMQLLSQEGRVQVRQDLQVGPPGGAGELQGLHAAARHHTLPLLHEDWLHFYMKTGSCNFGSTCKFDHPESPSSHPQVSMHAFSQAAAAKVAELQANAGIHASYQEQDSRASW
eukprot:CAMPEP_0179077018 /NCGR_PEP_ID=MMETSP0796-20121207/34400_1 /TAXON_ID=73915 /ORGANISM="Pyrodinium bahamense, Strain pbaha01" /LENGTH=519 /DNA_ID=CAMNT_0020774289 /DNA_START=20 /DNA_END=1576 /DNA_ORIENTATION=+